MLLKLFSKFSCQLFLLARVVHVMKDTGVIFILIKMPSNNSMILLQEAKLCVKEKFSTSTIKYFVQVTLDWVLDRDSTKRRMVGQFYHDLIVEKLLSVDQFLEG